MGPPVNLHGCYCWTKFVKCNRVPVCYVIHINDDSYKSPLRELAASPIKKAITDKCLWILAQVTGSSVSVLLPPAVSKSTRPANVSAP